MKKKVVAMFLAAVMALSLVACGSKSDNGGSGDASAAPRPLSWAASAP